jgi:Carboxypeptidase regulatory-like domain
MSIRLFWLLSILISPIPPCTELLARQFQVNQPNPNAPTFTLQGVVINAVTGEPVHAALVQIHFPRQNSMLTAADGKFRFEGIPQAQINLTVRKPGFFSEQELRQGAAYVDRPIQVGPDMMPVILKLVPEGVIYGRVTGPDGEPINNLPVRLLYGAITEGERNWQQRGGGQTNDEGEFRLFGLMPGIYYLSAGPRASPVPPPGRGTDASPQGYGATYYGGGSDTASAAPITITPGKQIRADLSVQPEPLHQVSGLVVGAPAGTPVNVQLSTADGQMVPAGIRTNPQDGAFMAFIPSGSYVLKATMAGKGGPVGVGIQPLTLTGDTAGIRLDIGPTAIIPITVEVRSTRNAGPDPRPNERQLVNVQLISQGSLLRTMRTSTLEGPPENRMFAIRNVEPGAYRVRIRPFGPWYVESARRGPANLLTDDLSIDAGEVGAPIEIVLRDDLAALTGMVLSRGQPAQGIVVLIPDSRAQGPIALPVQPSGKFEKRDLPPGEYRVFAFDRIDGLEYLNPEAMRSFSSAAQLVRLAPNGEATANLELQLRGE